MVLGVFVLLAAGRPGRAGAMGALSKRFRPASCRCRRLPHRRYGSAECRWRLRRRALVRLVAVRGEPGKRSQMGIYVRRGIYPRRSYLLFGTQTEDLL